MLYAGCPPKVHTLHTHMTHGWQLSFEKEMDFNKHRLHGYSKCVCTFWGDALCLHFMIKEGVTFGNSIATFTSYFLSEILTLKKKK